MLELRTQNFGFVKDRFFSTTSLGLVYACGGKNIFYKVLFDTDSGTTFLTLLMTKGGQAMSYNDKVALRVYVGVFTMCMKCDAYDQIYCVNKRSVWRSSEQPRCIGKQMNTQIACVCSDAILSFN